MEAARIASLNLPGRATDLAVILLVYLNPEHGVAFPGVEELASKMGTSLDTVGRAAGILDAFGVVRFAKRRGAAARWFPALIDMTGSEAKLRVKILQANWRAKQTNGPASMRDQLADPAKLRPFGPAGHFEKVRDLNTPSERSNIKPIAANVGEEAFKLVDEIADIVGLTAQSWTWPKPWRNAHKVAEQWLTNRKWPRELCLSVIRKVMTSRRRGAPEVQSLQYFEAAIEREWNGIEAQPKSRAHG